MSDSHPKPTMAADDEPRSKRQRISLACDPCRARKTRCDGARPSCGVCIDMDFDCKYQRPARQFNAPSQDKEHITRIEDRLHTMERMLQTMMGNIGTPSSQEISNVALVEQNQTGMTPQRAMTRSSESHGPPDATGETIYANGDDMSVFATLQEDTVDGMGVITFADELASACFGPTSNSAFFSHIAKAMPRAPVVELHYSQQLTPASNVNVNYISRPPSPPPPSSENPRQGSVGDVYALPSKSRIVHLVDIFFTEIGMTFPYIYKKWVLDGLAEMKLTHFYGVRRSWLCLLNTIMAFATCLPTIPNGSVEIRDAEADVFLQRALKLLPNITLKPANLEMFQALLLMTQYLQGTQRSAQTWNLHRLSVQAAYQVGVHSSTGCTKYSPLEREIRKRSWYMCFILDKTCSMTFGRPPAIPNSYLLLDLPLDVDLEALDESLKKVPRPPIHQSQEGLSTVIVYIQSIKIYRLIGQIIDELYQNNIETDTGLSNFELLQRVVSIEQRLSIWKSELPLNLQVKSKDEIIHDLDNSPVFSRLSAVITLRYLNARILLHRPTLTRFLDHDDTTPRSEPEWAFLRQFGISSIEMCTLSALEMIDIIHSLSEHQHRMHTTWWFLIYYSFSSALVVFSTMILQRKHGIKLPGCEHQDLAGSLQHALTSLENFGNGSRMANRCQKYLKKLIQIATTSGMANGFMENFLRDPDLTVPGTATPAGGLSDLSPLDFDVGPFMLGYGYGWDGVFR